MTGNARRKPVQRHRGARAFNNGVHKTHAYNLKIMRGGWRL